MFRRLETTMCWLFRRPQWIFVAAAATAKGLVLIAFACGLLEGRNRPEDAVEDAVLVPIFTLTIPGGNVLWLMAAFRVDAAFQGLSGIPLVVISIVLSPQSTRSPLTSSTWCVRSPPPCGGRMHWPHALAACIERRGGARDVRSPTACPLATAIEPPR